MVFWTITTEFKPGTFQQDWNARIHTCVLCKFQIIKKTVPRLHYVTSFQLHKSI